MDVRENFSVVELFSTICHDVRAALAVTAGAANELHQGGELDDSQRALVGMIQRGNNRLARLAQTVAYLSELWEGDLEVRPGTCDLGELVSPLVSEAAAREPSSRAQRVVELPQAPVLVRCDVDHTRHLIASLLGVALSAARAQLQVKVEQTQGGACVIIEDDGPARPAPAPTAHARVSSTALCYGVCTALAKAQGGRLEIVTPVASAGCRVTLSLPGVNDASA